MKKISIWANTHTSHAIGIFVLIETIRLLFGFWIGSQLLLSHSEKEIGFMTLFIAAIFFGTDTWRRTRVGEKLSFTGTRKVIAVGMTCSLLLAMLAGDSFTKRYQKQLDSNEVSMCSEREADALPVVYKYDELNGKNTNVSPDREFKAGWARLRCFLFFLLGLVLTYFGVYLACSLACAELGFLAVLVIIVTAGVYGGAFYFLLRGLRKNYKPWREMTKQERKREWLKYIITTITAVVLTVFFSAII